MADGTPNAPKKPGQINIFVMMLFVALLALCLGCGLLVLELARYNFQKEPPPSALGICSPTQALDYV